MIFRKQTLQVGNSLGITIPKHIINSLGIELGEEYHFEVRKSTMPLFIKLSKLKAENKGIKISMFDGRVRDGFFFGLSKEELVIDNDNELYNVPLEKIRSVEATDRVQELNEDFFEVMTEPELCQLPVINPNDDLEPIDHDLTEEDYDNMTREELAMADNAKIKIGEIK